MEYIKKYYELLLSQFSSRFSFLGSFTGLLLGLLALVFDLRDVSDGILGGLFDPVTIIDTHIEALLVDVNADKVGAFAFIDMERVLITDTSGSGASAITKSNHVVSLGLPPFDELWITHRKEGKCWFYGYYGGVVRNQLDDGMKRGSNKNIISCPVYTESGKLQGTLGVGFSTILTASQRKEIEKSIKETSVIIGPFLEEAILQLQL